jgi:hypothetical protein
MAEYPLIVHECSHLRRVVQLDTGFWHHVNPVGIVTASVCSAGVFRFEVARPRNAHALSTDIAATQPNDVGRYHEQPRGVL